MRYTLLMVFVFTIASILDKILPDCLIDEILEEQEYEFDQKARDEYMRKNNLIWSKEDETF